VSSKHMVIVRGGSSRLVAGSEPRPRLWMPSCTDVYWSGSDKESTPLSER
jgi:hypothetical protein